MADSQDGGEDGRQKGCDHRECTINIIIHSGRHKSDEGEDCD
jgi:hypothetical protein